MCWPCWNSGGPRNIPPNLLLKKNTISATSVRLQRHTFPVSKSGHFKRAADRQTLKDSDTVINGIDAVKGFFINSN